MMRFMRNHMLFYIAISFLIGCYSCAQEKGNDSKQQNIISLAEMEEEDFLYERSRYRLHVCTTLEEIKAAFS